MIIDNLKNSSMYYGLGTGVAAGLKFLQETDLSSLQKGRHDLEGGKSFAIVSDYDTKPTEEGLWEAHRKYIDIQFVVTGSERMGYANIDSLKAQPYDEENDFVGLEGEGDYFTVDAGEFAIFAPQDGHMPGLLVESPQAVRKVIVKVPAI